MTHQMGLPLPDGHSVLVKRYGVVDDSGWSDFRTLEEAETEWERLDQRGIKCTLWAFETESNPNLDFHSTYTLRNNGRAI